MRPRLKILGQVVLVALGAVALARWAHTCPAPAATPLEVVTRPPPPPAEPMRLAAIAETVEVAPGEVDAVALARTWAAQRALVLTVDPHTTTTRIAFERATTLDAEALREVLDAHDLVLVRGRSSTLHLVHRRNLATKFGPPWDTVADGAAVDPDRIVTRTIVVRHGAGNDIFATLRGFGARDMNRIGNLLYVAGAEQIVMVDFARNVRWYEELITSLDLPGPSSRAISASRAAAGDSP